MKMVTDYEVEGCWSGLHFKTKCRVCGAIMKRVPKEGHYNSRYWELQRHDREQLICCPNGCSEKEAVKKVRRTK